jgi:hypothetical protein
MADKPQTTNPCFEVPWEIAFEYGSDRTSNAWVITDGCVPGFPESEKRVGIILRDVPVELAKYIVHVHNASLL